LGLARTVGACLLFPIPAKGSRKVVLRYQQVLTSDGPRQTYVYPLSLGAERRTPIDELSIDVEVSDGGLAPLRVVPSGYPATVEPAANVARVALRAQAIAPDHDFAVSFDRATPSATLGTVEPGFVALRLRAELPAGAPVPPFQPRDRVLVVDASHSQSAQSFAAARSLALAVLNSMEPDERFALLLCDSACEAAPKAGLALATGEARVVVGARSAIFAPLQNLRLIVVDEEHEPAYKQDETPRYHGRDVAVMRAKLAQAVCVLGSATPSLESFTNASTGKYQLLQLTQRVDARQLPRIDIVDMRIEVARSRGLTTLSRKLVDEMQARLERREQTILFINRRGYSSSMQCIECGHVEECEHCSIAMTYHRTDERLRCHLCGAERPAPITCPKCKSVKIRWRGLGTQRVEEAVRRLLPKARMERMDTDTMTKRHRFREILSEFRAGRIDVLVGTQMIGKGLDFPNVTLVGLIDADISMHVPDFRANERTFQLLVQVAGRAGRGDRAGEVVVQTFTPQAEAIQFSRQADFAGFAESELKMRHDFNYPPYRHLIHHLFRGPNPEKLQFFAEQWARLVEKEIGERVELRGPSPSPIEKIKDEYRYQLWYFTSNVTKVIADLNRLRAEFAWPHDLIQVLDVDPVNLT